MDAVIKYRKRVEGLKQMFEDAVSGAKSARSDAAALRRKANQTPAEKQAKDNLVHKASLFDARGFELLDELKAAKEKLSTLEIQLTIADT